VAKKHRKPREKKTEAKVRMTVFAEATGPRVGKVIFQLHVPGHFTGQIAWGSDEARAIAGRVLDAAMLADKIAMARAADIVKEG